MSVASHRTLSLCAVAAVLAASAGARAADTDASESTTLQREWVGLELTPISYATSQPPRDGRSDASFSALQAGPGGSIRLGRYRWEYAYVIPFMASLYVSSGDKTIFAHMQGEGGLIVPGTDRRLELGVGFGVGILAVRYANGCDGACIIGGSGFMASLAARFLFWTAPTFTAGIGARAIMPLAEPAGESFGYYTGHSSVVMGALEVGFGRPSRPERGIVPVAAPVSGP
jgi:hypothetical protein